jgi:hypothetical protein
VELIRVRLLGIPLDIHQRSVEHGAEVLREFSHMQDDPGPSHAPSRLIALHRSLRARYQSFSQGIYADLDAAIARGDETADLEFAVPLEAARSAGLIADLWEEVDRFCEQGHYVLALTTPPELVAYRRWFLEQFTHQAAGHEPIPWSAWLT